MRVITCFVLSKTYFTLLPDYGRPHRFSQNWKETKMFFIVDGENVNFHKYEKILVYVLKPSLSALCRIPIVKERYFFGVLIV